jgi:hypothetical protein
MLSQRPTRTRRTRQAPWTAVPMRRAHPTRRAAASGSHGLMGRLRRQKQTTGGSRKGPALLAVVAGLGAAGAAALKRRRSGDDQRPWDVPPPEPVGEPTAETDAIPPPGSPHADTPRTA